MEPEVLTVAWVGGPLCGEAFLATVNTSHILFEEQFSDATYFWRVPIEGAFAVWRGRIATDEAGIPVAEKA